MREGAIRIGELAGRARALGMPAIALTDRDSLAGAVRFTQACAAFGVKPIYGARITLDGSLVTLLARDARGYEHLCRIITAAHHNGERGTPCASMEDVRAYADGLFVLLGPESDVGRALERHRFDLAQPALRNWLEIFGFHRTRIEVRSWLER